MLPSFPPCLLFTTRGFQCTPSCKRDTHKKKLPQKKGTHSGANDWKLNTKPVTTQDITNGLSPEAPKATS